MSTLDKKIENYIFGNIPTSELLDKAYDIKVQNFGKTVTYSPKVFIPLTTLCQDACAYCTFVKTPKDGGTYLTFEEVDAIANVGDKSGCFEALFTLGDKPEIKWSFAKEELERLGFSTTFDYLIENAKRVNEKYYLFPHINPGLMSRKEIKEYRQYSPSGGLMLESFSKNLSQKGKAHYGAKTKDINLRLETLENAMSEKYPMTTGLLLGITDRNIVTCQSLGERLLKMGYRVEIDTRNEKIGFKIREHTLQKIPYLLVIGDKESETGEVSVRTRSGQDLGRMPLDNFIKLLDKSISSKGRVTLDPSKC